MGSIQALQKLTSVEMEFVCGGTRSNKNERRKSLAWQALELIVDEGPTCLLKPLLIGCIVTCPFCLAVAGIGAFFVIGMLMNK